MFNGAVKEASGAEADGWRGTNASEIGVEREALYLGDREQEEVEPWLPGRPCRRSCARRAAGAPRDAHSSMSREPGAETENAEKRQPGNQEQVDGCRLHSGCAAERL